MTSLPPASPARRLAGAAFLLVLIGVVWGSLIRMPPAPGGGHVDKVEHFLAYATLSGLGFAARGRRSWLMVTGLAALGAGVEALQAILPTGRTGSFLDLLANIAGVLTVWAVWKAAGRLQGRGGLPPGANGGDRIHP